MIIGRRCAIWTAVLAVVAFIAVALYLAFFSGWTAAKLDRLIRAELPLGSDRKDVEAWLDRHGIEWRYFAEPEDRSFNEYIAQEAGVNSTGFTGVVQGIVGFDESREHWLLNSEQHLYFFIDGEGKLMGFWVDGAIYGP